MLRHVPDHRQPPAPLAARPPPDYSDGLLSGAYGSLSATLSWVILVGHPDVERVLDLLDEVDALLDAASKAGELPIPASPDNYGERYQWVISRLPAIAATGLTFARIAEIEALRFQFLPRRN